MGKTHWDDSEFLTLCESDDTAKIEEALNNGANVNARDEDGNTALHWEYRGDIARVLLEHGADVNAKNNDGSSVLRCATSPEVLDLLIEYGADVDARDDSGMTALHWAAIQGYAAFVEALAVSSDVNAKDNYGNTPLDYAAGPEIEDLLVILGARRER